MRCARFRPPERPTSAKANPLLSWKDRPLTDIDTYLNLAAKARTEADAATLDNVRDRCLRSAEAWDVMAERVRRTTQMRDTLDAEKKKLRESAEAATG